MHESVLSMRVVTSDGAVVAVDRSHELFGRVIGGFGLFGVVTELALKTTANLKLDVELVKASAAEFPALYDKVLADGTVDVKLARVNITTSKDLQLFVFRRTSDDPTVSDLAPRANEMGLAMSLLYKWVMPLRFFQRMRYLFEVGGFCFLHAGPANEILLEYVHWTAGVKVCAAQKSHRRHMVKLGLYAIVQTQKITWVSSRTQSSSRSTSRAARPTATCSCTSRLCHSRTSSTT